MLPFLQLILAIILILTAAKAGGYISYRLGQPAVAGEVLAGLILGPSVLNILQLPVFADTHLAVTITHLAELGVLFLLFMAGLDLHLADFLKSGKTALLAGSIGFILTLGMGYTLALGFSFDTQQALFVGLVLAPTSIGISAQTLMELKVLRSKVGTTLLGAAAVDDTLGILGVALFLAMFSGDVSGGLSSIFLILLKMSLYLVFATAFGILMLPKITKLIEKLPISQGLVTFAFITMLLYSWAAEELGQMATIIGAFLAGLFFSRSSLKDKIKTGISSIAYGIFVPVFFINVGLSADLRQFTKSCGVLLIGMVVVVVFSKLIGSGLGGFFGKLSMRESAQLGFGMIPRGEVVLILATIGVSEGLIEPNVFSAAVALVIFTTLITPPILRSLFSQSTGSSQNLDLDSGR